VRCDAEKWTALDHSDTEDTENRQATSTHLEEEPIDAEVLVARRRKQAGAEAGIGRE